METAQGKSDIRGLAAYEISVVELVIVTWIS